MPQFDAVDCCLMNTISSRNGFYMKARTQIIPYLIYVLVCQLGFAAFAPSWGASVPNHVFHVLFASTVLEIREEIVGPISVQMPAIHPIRTRADKRFKDESMHKYKSLIVAFASKQHSAISFACDVSIDQPRYIPPSTRTTTPHAPMIRYHVSAFESRDVFPSFGCSHDFSLVRAAGGHQGDEPPLPVDSTVANRAAAQYTPDESCVNREAA